VSIITALNAHKDEINRLGSLHFAAETKQSLHHFFSQDSLPSKESKERKKCVKGMVQFLLEHKRYCGDSLHVQTQIYSWKAFSLYQYANYDLCQSATELCMTKGQEAVVAAHATTLSPLVNPNLSTSLLGGTSSLYHPFLHLIPVLPPLM